jgi:hypothetical protein
MELVMHCYVLFVPAIKYVGCSQSAQTPSQLLQVMSGECGSRNAGDTCQGHLQYIQPLDYLDSSSAYFML